MRALRLSSLVRDKRAAAVVEFAFVLPAFLMLIFLMLEGGRMLFTKQALNEAAAAMARCEAVEDGCSLDKMVEQRKGGPLRLTTHMIEVTPPDAPGCQTGMVQVSITMPYSSAALGLLPHAIAPSSLTATSCFPVMGAEP